ncbi:MAG: lytic transglycosylase domain-containing protein [Pseudomonadota bacterium]
MTKRAKLCALVGTVLIAAGPLAAQSTDFTFKRVKPPVAGAKRLINIQIETVAAVAPVLSNIPNVPDAPRPDAVRPPLGPGEGSAAWFWAQMSPALKDRGAHRLGQATQLLAERPGRSADLLPAASRMETLAATYGAEILEATAGTQVSPALVLAVMMVESAGQPKAKSPAGAVGLMQLMPATAARFDVTDRTDPGQSIRGGVAYLQFLLDTFDADALLALAGYNAGEGAVTRAAGVPDYRETRDYVPKVVAAWSQARLLCLSPPVKATDGCLFSGLQVARQ